MNMLQRCFWLLLMLLAVSPVRARETTHTEILFFPPATSRHAIAQQLPADAQLRAWLPEIGAAVVRVPAGAPALRMPGLLRSEADAPIFVLDDGPDVLLPQQYALTTTATLPAWNTATGAGVVVAVIDTGVDVAHPDLAEQLWTNPSELANGVDDDGNGFVDDLHGWAFWGETSDNNIGDAWGHGTHVAGIVAARRGNAEGIAGIAPAARLMVLKVLGTPADGDGSESDVAQAVLYAVNEGAQVINISLGGEADTEVLRQAVAYATSQGVVVVAAAGNSNSAVLYPAAYPSVIAVASLNSSDQRANSSSYGPQMSVSAPGVGIWSAALSAGVSCRSNGIYAQQGYYALCSGTSMAAPHVAGASALIRQQRPTLSPFCTRLLLERTADDLRTPGYDIFTGWGRINVARALAAPDPCFRLWLPLVR